MNLHNTPATSPPGACVQAQTPGFPAPALVVADYDLATPVVRSRMLAQLVGQVYENASLPVRGLLLQKLLQPMGILALVSVAGGIFAKIRLRSGLQEAPLRLEDVRNVSTSDVLALVERAQDAGSGALHGLGEVIVGSPVLASSAAASLLLMLLVNARRARRNDDLDA